MLEDAHQQHVFLLINLSVNLIAPNKRTAPGTSGQISVCLTQSPRGAASPGAVAALQIEERPERKFIWMK